MSRKERLRELFGEFSSSDDEVFFGAEKPPPNPPPEKRRQSPRVGTVVQRFDAVNRRKAILLTTPPPRVRATQRRRVASAGRDTRAPVPQSRASTMTSRCATVATSPPRDGYITAPVAAEPSKTTPPRDAVPAVPGTSRPPVLQVQVAPGVTLAVPHHAAYIVRRFRAWTPEGKWFLRFGPNGRVRSSRFRPRGDTAGPSTATTAPKGKG